MKQLIQDLKNGQTTVEEVPRPLAGPRHLLVRSEHTLVSPGTERMLVSFGQAGLLGKARRQPDRVKQVLRKAKTDGLSATVKTVRSRLDRPLPLGYCQAGIVEAVGEGLEDRALKRGDRVVTNGPHAEWARVPVNLCIRVPETVSLEHAPFAIPGAIALQGMRLLQPALGETVVVSGLGLIGLLAAQLLRAHGCTVIGVDPNPDRRRLAAAWDLPVADPSDEAGLEGLALSKTEGHGVDGVLIAAATESNDVVRQAARLCRTRGRIVLVGVAGLALERDLFYKKELSFQVSCSYGPGRYDPAYEEGGQDYPYGHVRWTEQRNIEAVLRQMESGALDVAPLVSRHVPLEKAPALYRNLETNDDLGILIDYAPASPTPLVRVSEPRARPGEPVVAVLGAGAFATGTLLPALAGAAVRLKTVVSEQGVSAAHAAKKFGAEEAGTDPASVFADPEVNTVVVATRHDTHADLAVRALHAGKHVFVEKPLGITREELGAIEEALQGSPPLLMAGFNRRFAPLLREVKAWRDGLTQPPAMIITVNAGALPADHWAARPEQGGRLVGEACHFIDLLRFLAGAGVETVSAHAAASPDTVSVSLSYTNGAMGTLHYFANGHRSFPKERLELFGDGAVVQLDNFRKLRAYGVPSLQARSSRQDKGHVQGLDAFLRAVREGGPAPIPVNELVEVTRTTLDIVEQLT